MKFALAALLCWSSVITFLGNTTVESAIGLGCYPYSLDDVSSHLSTWYMYIVAYKEVST